MVSDAARISQLASDPEVALQTGSVPHPYPEAEVLSWLQTLPVMQEAGTLEVYVLVSKADGLLVGVADLRRTEFAHALEVGFWVGRPHWGQGFCTEALGALVDFAFRRDPELLRIYTLAFPENHASLRVQEKVGFQREGYLRHGLARLKEPRDAVISAIVRADWRQRVEPT